MIHELEITNFKSIRHLKLDCARINIFIGEPNTGKSNILEALGFLSYGLFSNYGELKDFVRYVRTSNLFYDEFIDTPVEIRLDKCGLKLEFKEGRFEGEIHVEGNIAVGFVGDYNVLRFHGIATAFKNMPRLKFYRFKVPDRFDRLESEYLLPPNGRNLLSLLMTKRELRSTLSQIFTRSGLKLGLKPTDSLIELIKQIDDVLISYPYSLVSDTLQRVVFYLSAVLSNKDSILVFEEPEAHAFPYYTKYMAEIMALDEGKNQYFISTHNPYFLQPLIAKTPKEELAVFVTYFEDYQTKVRPLSPENIEEIMQIDVFSNIDRYKPSK